MRHRLFVPWLALSIGCVALMWAFPGVEVVPFHAIWIGFAFVYGLEPWPLRRTTAALGLLGLATGAILLHRAHTDVIAWEETAETPLMWALAVLVVWHVQRRHQALSEVSALAAGELERATGRERLARLTSHEMRTPLTIASGYVDLLLTEEQDRDRRQDLEVVRDELGRLTRAADRVLRMIQLPDRLDRQSFDLDDLLEETAQRWATVAPRTWSVESGGGAFDASRERLRACLDTLIENSVRYTDVGDTVRLFSFRRRGSLWLGVADSGPGLSRELCDRLNGRAPSGTESVDPQGQTGLGMGIVREIAERRGGCVRAGRSREGGALLVLVLPLVQDEDGAATSSARQRQRLPG